MSPDLQDHMNISQVPGSDGSSASNWFLAYFLYIYLYKVVSSPGSPLISRSQWDQNWVVNINNIDNNNNNNDNDNNHH